MKHKEIYTKYFPDVNVNELNHHIIPTVSDDRLGTVIIHVDVNDMLSGTDSDDLILQIGRVRFTCKNYKVKNIIISGLVYTGRIRNDGIDYVNKKLQKLCHYQD